MEAMGIPRLGLPVGVEILKVSEFVKKSDFESHAKA